MAINTKAIKRRITSVKNTKKITKAMEMVSAAKMRKAVEATLRARVYSNHARGLLSKLSYLQSSESVYLETRENKTKSLMVLVTSNRGLCGSFNASVIKRANQLLEELKGKGFTDISVMGIGKKGVPFAKRNNLPLIGVYDEIGDKPQYSDIYPIIKQITSMYANKEVDDVHIVYMGYKSSVLQIPMTYQLLPLDPEELSSEDTTSSEDAVTTFEPSAEVIIESVIPRLVESQLLQAVLENAAGEHSARMVAMKNASDSATDMIKRLTLAFNKGRQAAITQEIAEIAGGAAALE